MEEPHGDEYQVALALWLRKTSVKTQAVSWTQGRSVKNQLGTKAVRNLRHREKLMVDVGGQKLEQAGKEWRWKGEKQG